MKRIIAEVDDKKHKAIKRYAVDLGANIKDVVNCALDAVVNGKIKLHTSADGKLYLGQQKIKRGK